MSTAWEVTVEDVKNVLAQCGVTDEETISKAYDIVIEDADRMIDAVLFYTDIDEQTDAANKEIKEILVENGIVEDVGTKV